MRWRDQLECSADGDTTGPRYAAELESESLLAIGEPLLQEDVPAHRQRRHRGPRRERCRRHLTNLDNLPDRRGGRGSGVLAGEVFKRTLIANIASTDPAASSIELSSSIEPTIRSARRWEIWPSGLSALIRERQTSW